MYKIRIINSKARRKRKLPSYFILSTDLFGEDGHLKGAGNLYSLGGALIQSWMTQGGSTMRTLTMPADIAAGVYVLQVLTKGGACTRKVVVE
jgi:hypothetical protein